MALSSINTEKTLESYYMKDVILDSDIQKNVDFLYGDVKLITNYDSIMQSIHNILNTKKGEMVGLTDFGCSLQNYLFTQLTINNIEDLKRTVMAEIMRYEPRITIIDFRYTLNQPIGTLIIDMIFNVNVMGGNQVYRESVLLTNQQSR